MLRIFDIYNAVSTYGAAHGNVLGSYGELGNVLSSYAELHLPLFPAMCCAVRMMRLTQRRKLSSVVFCKVMDVLSISSPVVSGHATMIYR